MSVSGITRPEFGAALERRRLARGLSLSKLAELAGVDHSYVSRLTAGKRSPSYSVVLALALALGCTEPERDVLLMFAGYLPPGWREIDSDLLRLHAAINDRGLPAAQRDDLREVVRSLVRLAEARTVRPVPVEEAA